MQCDTGRGVHCWSGRSAGGCILLPAGRATEGRGPACCRPTWPAAGQRRCPQSCWRLNTLARFCNSSTAQHTTFGWLRYSGFVRHKEPSLDAVGALADLLVFTFNLTGLDILQTIEAQETSWWQYRLLFRDLHHADKKQDHNSLAKPLQSILQEVEGHPVVKTKVLHLFRDSGVILLASGGAGLELLQICGPWARGSLGQAYIERNLLAALQAFAIPGGWEQTSFMKRHFLGRALVAVPDECIDRLLPGVRRVNELVKARNSWLQTGGKRQAHDKVSDRAAEGFLQTTLYTGVAFWQNLPFRTQRRNSALHRNNRHLPQLIEYLMDQGTSVEVAVDLLSQMADSWQLSLGQMREGARLYSSKTSKRDEDTVTPDTAMTIGQFRS
ncbi:hypothetical protein WJX77_006334 [Trebouxia sp. C0004]